MERNFQKVCVRKAREWRQSLGDRRLKPIKKKPERGLERSGVGSPGRNPVHRGQQRGCMGGGIQSRDAPCPEDPSSKLSCPWCQTKECRESTKELGLRRTVIICCTRVVGLSAKQKQPRVVLTEIQCAQSGSSGFW